MEEISRQQKDAIGAAHLGAREALAVRSPNPTTTINNLISAATFLSREHAEKLAAEARARAREEERLARQEASQRKYFWWGVIITVAVAGVGGVCTLLAAAIWG